MVTKQDRYFLQRNVTLSSLSKIQEGFFLILRTFWGFLRAQFPWILVGFFFMLAFLSLCTYDECDGCRRGGENRAPPVDPRARWWPLRPCPRRAGDTIAPTSWRWRCKSLIWPFPARTNTHTALQKMEMTFLAFSSLSSWPLSTFHFPFNALSLELHLCGWLSGDVLGMPGASVCVLWLSLSLPLRMSPLHWIHFLKMRNRSLAVSQSRCLAVRRSNKALTMPIWTMVRFAPGRSALLCRLFLDLFGHRSIWARVFTLTLPVTHFANLNNQMRISCEALCVHVCRPVQFQKKKKKLAVGGATNPLLWSLVKRMQLRLWCPASRPKKGGWFFASQRPWPIDTNLTFQGNSPA